MEESKEKVGLALGKFKKLILLLILGFLGILLTLSGLSLIQLSPSLVLYSGIILLVLSLILYFLP